MAKIITDLHFHSKYSRAVSRDMDLEHMARWADIKGLDVITAADFTHPVWFKELSTKLELQKNGLYKLRGSSSTAHFMLTTELSCIYSKNNRTRRIHLVVIMPDLETVATFNDKLSLIGKLKSDGRPILGIDAKEIVRMVMETSDQAMAIPAHIWTPWFSMFGSESGFDTVAECFDEMSKYIYAIETGISSDPPMNWRLSQLDRLAIVSFSDAHSMEKMGREGTVFELEQINYSAILKALKQQGGEKNKIAYTIEFYPEEGRYHWDGHRDCKISFSPAETKKHKGICPKCKKRLTIGTLNRVDKLADRPLGFKSANRPPFKSLVPLREIIAECLGLGVSTKGVAAEFESMIRQGKNELNILLNLSPDELNKITTPNVALAIAKVRRGEITVIPGYDGEYGVVKVFSNKEREKYLEKQKKLL
jgi:uncharacterized protein (TIGR00375 family)